MQLPDYCLLEKTSEQKYYLYLFESYCGQFLTFVPRTIPDYSSHGVDHSMRIIDNINRFVRGWGLDFTQKEILLLYLAAWVHDIGCVVDRDRHHEISVKLMEEDDAHLDIPDEYKTILKYLILAHRKSYNLNEVQADFSGVRLRLLCAVFRLMDACEITRFRCPRAVFNAIESTLDSKSKEIWLAHMNIKDVNFLAPKIIISVNDALLSQWVIDDLKRDLDTVVTQVCHFVVLSKMK